MIRLSHKTDTAEIVLTGRTYEHRADIKDMGGRWNGEDKSWTLPAEREAWAIETLGAQPVATATAKTETRTVTSLGEADFARLERYVDNAVEGKADALAPDFTETFKDELQQLSKAVHVGIEAEVSNRTAELVARLDAAERRAEEARVLVVDMNGKRHKVEGKPHPMLETLITSLAAGLHVWIAGPSGSGKTHGAMMAAAALGLKFEAQGAMTMAHELTGFVDAGGRYHDTPFVRAFKDGGLILLDEIDAGSNEALLALNAALANGFMSLPTGEVVKAHADFKCIGAANTFGNGATAEYVGRVRLDAAFLQRFGARLDWGYDEALERAIAGNDEWTSRVQRARRRAAEHGLKVMITPRQSIAGARLIAAGMSADDAAEITYLAGLTIDQREMLA